MFQQRRKPLEIINLGILASINPSIRKFEAHQVINQTIEPFPSKRAIYHNVVEFIKAGIIH